MVLVQEKITETLKDYSKECLLNSPFFNDLQNKPIPQETLQHIFGQYYFWRNYLHRWFGLCIEKSPEYGQKTDDATTAALRSLTGHINIDVVGHFEMYKSFLDSMQIDTEYLKPLSITTDYNESFSKRYHSRTFEEATCALAARELLSSIRSKIIGDALQNNYNFENVEFWRAHEESEEEHFQSLWNALTDLNPNYESLTEAAKVEIYEHVKYFDNLYTYYQI